MSDKKVTFKAVDLDAAKVLGVYDSQRAAMDKVHEEGQEVHLQLGEERNYAVVFEAEGREPFVYPMTVRRGRRPAGRQVWSNGRAPRSALYGCCCL